jgi:ribose transport system substrate-binding protein
MAMCALLAGCSRSDEAPAYRIAVVPKGTSHMFWKSVHAGALTARNDLAREGIAVDIRWKGPIREDDRSQQVGVVETFIGQGVDGIILAPLDRKALLAPIAMARQAGIPAVIFDSALDDAEVVSFVATDNFRGGELAGHHLAEQLGGSGRVIVLRYQVGSASTEDREAGCLAALAQYPEIEVISSNQYAGATRDSAFTAAQNLVSRRSGQFDGVFASNESATNGMLLALRELGLAGSVAFVGFDGGQQNLAALESGDIDALVIQDPFRMGYDSVTTLVAHLRGETVPEVIDTGVTVVTADQLGDPEIQRLLLPPLDVIEAE